MNLNDCRELAKHLEAVKKAGIQQSSVVEEIAQLIHDYDVRDMGLLNRLVASMSSTAGRREGATVIKPDAVLDADYLGWLLANWVRSLRECVFLRTETPFSSVEQAIAWLVEGSVDYFDKELVTDRKEAQFQTVLLFQKKSGSNRYRLLGIPDLPPVYGMEGALALVPHVGTNQEAIVKACKTLSDEWHIERTSLVLHVLCETQLYVPPYELDSGNERRTIDTDAGPVEYNQKWVNIRLNSYVGRGEWNDIYPMVRLQLKIMRVQRDKSLGGRHMELLEMVRRRGGVPRDKGKVKFWESIQAEWNVLHPDRPYETWKGVKLACDRAQRKVAERRHVVTAQNPQGLGEHTTGEAGAEKRARITYEFGPDAGY